MSGTEIVLEPGQPTIVVTRTFDAPPDVVFQVCTDPALVDDWWGPRGITTKVEVMDVRPGGRWRYVQQDADGNEFAFSGVYHSVSPQRVIQTFEFEPMAGHVLLQTTTFEEVDGRTLLTDQSVFQSVEDRDGMAATGMESGARESHDRLAELLARRA